MKKRIIFNLVLVALLVFGQNLFAVEVASEADTFEPDDEGIVSPQGEESSTNTFYGLSAGENTEGLVRYDSFFGARAGASNSSGFCNSFFGHESGEENTEGYNNSFFGNESGKKNTEGYNNSFFGYGTGFSNITGKYNSFFGMFAGFSNLTGFQNAFFGYKAGYTNETGMYNSFFGNEAGFSNTGHFNSFFGWRAGYKNDQGFGNVFSGMDAGFNNTTGDENSCFGYLAGVSNETGNQNAFFGGHAGRSNKEGSGNVFLGYKAGYNETGSERLYIANSSTDTPLIYGEFDNRFVKINANFTATATSISSDIRWKKNVQLLKSSLASVSALQGVSYEWKMNEYRNQAFKEGRQIGLVAQDVEKVLPELVSEDTEGYKAVSYAKLTAVLVEAVKELKAQNEIQKAEDAEIRSENKSLIAENAILKKDIDKIKKILGI